jgi:hypothetical protein
MGATRRPRLVLDDVVDPGDAHYHDPELLAREAGSRRGGIARTA